MISGRAGLAVALDGKRLVSIHADVPDRDVARRPEELRLLLGSGRDVVRIENISREETVRRLLLAQRREEALRYGLYVLDKDLRAETRSLAALELEELWREQEVAEYVEGVLLSHPLPEEGDIAGALDTAAAAPGVAGFLSILWDSQEIVAEVWEAWRAAAKQEIGAEDLELWRSIMVREGFFRRVVHKRRSGEGGSLIYLELATQLARLPAVRRLPNQRGVLQAWIRSR